METLNAAIRAAGGVSALARALGVRPNTISNWQSRGLPRAYAQLFELMRKHRLGVFGDITDVSTTTIGSSEQISTDRLPMGI